MSALDALVKALAKEIAALVVAELSASSITHYGTGKTATLPPGKSRAWALRTLKTIRGARRVGRDWIVSIEDFNAWLTEKDAARVVPNVKKLRPRPANDEDVSIEDSLAAAGLRRIR